MKKIIFTLSLICSSFQAKADTLTCVPNLIGEMPTLLTSNCQNLNDVVANNEKFLQLKSELESSVNETLVVSDQLTFVHFDQTTYAYASVTRVVCGILPCAYPDVVIGNIVVSIKQQSGSFVVDGAFFQPVAELPGM